MKQELLKGGTDSLILGLTDHSIAVTPYSCTVRILDGSTVLESGTATYGVYTPTSATTGESREDITVEWTFQRTSGAKIEKKVELVDVVLFKLAAFIDDRDLMAEAPGLGSEEFVYRGSVTSAVATGIKCAGLVASRYDWEGAIIEIVSGARDGDQAAVSAFDASDGELTYSATGYPVAADTFTLRRTFQGEIDSAWNDVYDRLVQACVDAGGARPSLVMSPDRLRRPHLYKALEKVYRGIATDNTGVDWARAEYYASAFDSVWSGIKLAFASPDSTDPIIESDGMIDNGFDR